jgi:hypothetical protein
MYANVNVHVPDTILGHPVRARERAKWAHTQAGAFAPPTVGFGSRHPPGIAHEYWGFGHPPTWCPIMLCARSPPRNTEELHAERLPFRRASRIAQQNLQ